MFDEGASSEAGEALERDHLKRIISDRPELLDVVRFRESLAGHGHKIITDPDDPAITERVVTALQDGRPYSVIRIGDGEINLLSYGREDTMTPLLDRWSAEKILAMQDDPPPSGGHGGLNDIRRRLEQSVRTADIVGILGLWRGRDADPSTWMMRMETDTRGMIGQIKGLLWAEAEIALIAPSTVIASAHLYIGILLHIERLLRTARRILCVSNRAAVVDALRERVPAADVQLIAIGDGNPRTFERTLARLSEARAGDLFLIGAGPWAEPYCEAVKAAGGVAVDLGSGMDLLSGLRTRPIHDRLHDQFGL